MKTLCLAALAVATSGCALFDRNEARTAAAAMPALALPAARADAAVEKPARFSPAFDAGAPVALVPCRNAAASTPCRRYAASSHQRRGDMPAGDGSERFNDALTVSLTQSE